MFFKSFSADTTHYFLCRSSGILYDIEDKDNNWALLELMKTCGFVPSKMHLYIVYEEIRNDMINVVIAKE